MRILSETMRIVVDGEKCQGHAQCWGLAPDLFELDELGFAHAASDDLTGDEVARARKAVTGCPERAITVEP
jgi:ferredoxin